MFLRLLMNELVVIDGNLIEETVLGDWQLTRPIPPSSTMTPNVVRTILGFIAAGNYVAVACAAAGVSRRTYYTWRQHAESQPDSCYAEFVSLADKAFAAAEAANIQTIKKAAATSWQAAAWLEERKHPDRWGQRSTTVLDGDLTVGIGAAGLIEAARKAALETVDD
jgi:hypothetical protein